ncbi:MAG TPA: hypothetical protein DDX84_10375 [Nitrospiraceae bacterium]|nr:hypothetical protein [Nitrospiraceae bacterium]
MKRVAIFSIYIFFIGLVYASQCSAAGKDIKLPSTGYGDDEFKKLSKEMGLIISYVPLAPAAPLGILGFDVGVEVTLAEISSGSDSWKLAMKGTPPDYIILPKIHAQKGLPFGIDVGAIFATVPGSNITLYGGEVKWAVLKGTIVSPAVAVRGTYTALTGVDDIDMSTYGLDASVSKGFGPLTPYGGLGQVWIKSSENSDIVTLDDVSTSSTKLFLGAKLKILLLSLVFQADFSDVNMYSARANISF